jgi:hypothetical protein
LNKLIFIKSKYKLNSEIRISTILLELPNGYLVIGSDASLIIYDKEFKLIKTIDKINNKTFDPSYLL